MTEEVPVPWRLHIICDDREVLPKVGKKKYFGISAPPDSKLANQAIQDKLAQEELLPPNVQINENAWLLIRQKLVRGHTALLLLSGPEVCSYYSSYPKAVTKWSLYANGDLYANRQNVFLYLRERLGDWRSSRKAQRTAASILVGGFAVYALTRARAHYKKKVAQKETPEPGPEKPAETKTLVPEVPGASGEAKTEAKTEGERFKIKRIVESGRHKFIMEKSGNNLVMFLVVKKQNSRKPSIAASFKNKVADPSLLKVLFKLLSEINGDTLFVHFHGTPGYVVVDPQTLKPSAETAKFKFYPQEWELSMPDSIGL